MATMQNKPIHSLVIDAGPIITGEPDISSLRNQCEEIICSPAVLAEIRDETARARIETTLKPFLTLRTPKSNSVQVIVNFAKRTGDFAVLSRNDIQLLALAYELECARNGGDWRLRKTPGQKRINGSAPVSQLSGENGPVDDTKSANRDTIAAPGVEEPLECPVEASQAPATQDGDSDQVVAATSVIDELDVLEARNAAETEAVASREETVENEDIDHSNDVGDDIDNEEEGVDDDGDGEWITPFNIKRRQLEEDTAAASGIEEPKVMQVAMITTDFAMQNVLLQMNLNLLSPSLHRVRHIKTFVLRCHACFTVVRDMAKQFCPKCGGDTLTRVTCSTNHKGEFQLHLKKNFQWNNRGAKYSIPKPVHGASNHRVKGGGKGGWGHKLILSEDQKEYTRAVESRRREKKKDLMDEDYLPSILSGARAGHLDRIQIGAGKHVNSKRR